LKKRDTFVLEAAPEFVLGFDIGGTRLKAGAVSPKGKLLAQAIVPTGAAAGPKALLMSIVALARAIEKEMGGPAFAVGLGLPGAIDPDRGVVLLPGRLKGLENFPLVPKLRKAFGVPVIADNDARLAMIAEKEYGQARGKGWALTLTIGTGLGSGVLIDGRIFRDPHLQFGTQASHMVIQSQGGRLCFTGARGTAEMLCSATALAQQVRDGLARGIVSLLSDRHAVDPHSIDFAAVLEGVAGGDRLCRDELTVWTSNLGWFLVSAVHAYSPEVVILTGGGAHGAKHFLKPLRAHVNKHLFRWPVGEPLPIVVSKMIDHAGVLGAAAQAWLFA
jgi:glucokinase